MNTRLPITAVLILFFCADTFAQQPSHPGAGSSSKYRTLLTLVGGGGGFALGFFIGFNAFDDAVNSDRKLWTTAALSAAGGAVGGYFLGRSLDKRTQKTTVTSATEEFYRALTDSQRRYRATKLAGNSPQSARSPIPSPADSGLGSGMDLPGDTTGPVGDLNRIYLLTALQKMDP